MGTLFFGGSILALPHDVDAPQWIGDDGPTMTWARLPTIEEFAERLAPVEDFQTQEREVFFGRRGLQLTHIVLFGDSSASGHEATIAAMTEAYASYKGRYQRFIDVSVRENAQVIRHFSLLPPGEPGLRLRSQDFPQVERWITERTASRISSTSRPPLVRSHSGGTLRGIRAAARIDRPRRTRRAE